LARIPRAAQSTTFPTGPPTIRRRCGSSPTAVHEDDADAFVSGQSAGGIQGPARREERTRGGLAEKRHHRRPTGASQLQPRPSACSMDTRRIRASRDRVNGWLDKSDTQAKQKMARHTESRRGLSGARGSHLQAQLKAYPNAHNDPARPTGTRVNYQRTTTLSASLRADWDISWTQSP